MKGQEAVLSISLSTSSSVYAALQFHALAKYIQVHCRQWFSILEVVVENALHKGEAQGYIFNFMCILF